MYCKVHVTYIALTQGLKAITIEYKIVSANFKVTDGYKPRKYLPRILL